MKKSMSIAVLLGILLFLFGACAQKTTPTTNDNQRQAPRQNQGTRPGGGAPPSFSNLISQMDEDGDGKLSKSEVTGPLANGFDKVDQNGDGYITEAEFQQAPPPPRRGN